MNLGNKIKTLRKQHNLTQENLAEMLGVSYQAISRWENNITSPDINTLPILANIFNVTVDYLLDVNVIKNEDNINKIYDEYYNLSINNQINECETLLEEGIKQYPFAFKLKNELLHIYYIKLLHSEEKLHYQNKLIKLATNIIENCFIDEYRYSAMQSLILVYELMKEYEKGKTILNKLPTISFSKDLLKEHTLTGKDKLIAQQENIYNILSMFEHLIYQLTPFKKTGHWDEVLLKYLGLIELIYENKDYGLYNYNLMNIYLFCAIDKARIKDKNLTINYLNQAINHATICTKLKKDNKIIMNTSFLVNQLQDDSKTWPITDNLLFNIILAELNKPEYDFIRDTKPFNEIISFLIETYQK